MTRYNSLKPPHEALLPDLDAALLVLVGASGGVTAYDVVALMKKGNAGLLGRSQASVYARLRALAEQGHLDAEDEVGKRGRRATRYRLDVKGNNAIHAWLRETHAELPALDTSEMFVRLRAANIEEQEVIWNGLKPLVFEIADGLALLEKRERAMRQSGAWAVDAERFAVVLKRRLLEAYRDSLDELRREYAMPDPLVDD